MNSQATDDASLDRTPVEGWSEAGDVAFHVREPAARSVSVTTVAVREGIDPEALRTLARERFQVGIAGGLGSLAGRIFRIGHLGDLNAPMVLGCLAGVEAAMQARGIAHGPGVARAVHMLAGLKTTPPPGPLCRRPAAAQLRTCTSLSASHCAAPGR
ncbi:hypothetical protein NU688_16715 [Variovorax sp. ZS18.2.2]|uniref:hypothetical protein n=1 Tax=Variovorax sp. ZS18.2.2 TaxID=2971255 RepID=UPI0021513BD9|nr:hypothetical protein [Variovorax sp. ZS18.2.2]MCR6477806.1 hypothetical protein [Variovorax sp. ZS18.2.2]